jgi:hypothetical protein
MQSFDTLSPGVTKVEASPPPRSAPRRVVTLLVMTRRRLVIVALAPVAAVAGIGANAALSKGNETTMTCRVTEANGRVPAGAPTGLIGNGRLATSAYSVVEASPRTLRPDGSISEKFPWFGASDLVGQLRISGTRLDRPARPLRARVNEGAIEGAPQLRFWASGITFTTPGCWKVVGRVGAVRLAFVVRVATPTPHALDTTPSYTVNPLPVRLPAKCRVPRVERRLLSMIHSFNAGQGDEFASNFTQRPSFQPYLGDVGQTYARRGHLTRSELARFVHIRYSAGDGWTASRLLTPQGTAGLPATAIYGLQLSVSYPGGSVAGGSKIVVSCSSGLVRRWVALCIAGRMARNKPPLRSRSCSA